MSIYLFHRDNLPDGFKFPRMFLDLIEKDALPDLAPWKFLCTSQRDADGWMLALQSLYPSRKLVPFALWVGSDDVACFDGASHSDEPVVLYIHAYASPGWEDRGQEPNFAEWLNRAEIQSAKFNQE